MGATDDRLVWIDLEMTGLEPDHDVIIEIATLITDQQLNVLAEGPVLAIHQPDARLAAMDEWNTRTHTASGLVERVQASDHDTAAAEQATLDFIKQWCTPKSSPICGNSICQDRRFLARYMPELEAYLHYRNLDVSTVKQLAKYWAPAVAAGVKKQGTHTALADIRESIAELQHYREHFFSIQP